MNIIGIRHSPRIDNGKGNAVSLDTFPTRPQLFRMRTVNLACELLVRNYETYKQVYTQYNWYISLEISIVNFEYIPSTLVMI